MKITKTDPINMELIADEPVFNPQVTVNNIPIVEFPNSVKYTEGFVDMNLITQQAALYYLETLDEVKEDKSFKETKRLLKRKISGDNPSIGEWRTNAKSFDYDYVKLRPPALYYYAKNKALSIADSNVYDRYFCETSDEGNGNGNAYCNAYGNDKVNNDDFYDVANYIISLLNGYIKPIDQLDSKVLNAINTEGNSLDMSTWHTCGTIHSRGGWEIALHPKGYRLEKHFGSRMAATLIHYISTCGYVHYYASKEEAMADLKLTSAKENKNAAN